MCCDCSGEVGGFDSGRGSFYEWFHARPDLKELKKTIRSNPGQALSAAFQSVGAVAGTGMGSSSSVGNVHQGGQQQQHFHPANPGLHHHLQHAGSSQLQVDVVLGQEQKLCLASRCGMCLKRNTILKSYVFPQLQVKSLDQLPGQVFNYYHTVAAGKIAGADTQPQPQTPSRPHPNLIHFSPSLSLSLLCVWWWNMEFDDEAFNLDGIMET